MGINRPRARNERDESEFSSFYEAELVCQVRHATLILGSRAAAQDVVHEAFVEVFRSWNRIVEPGPYLQTEVVNRCRDVMRRERVARRHQHLLVSPDVPEVDAPLYDALAQLPFNHRAAVVLRFYLQLGEAEIADRLGCAHGSVGPWIRRGLDRLSKELRTHSEEHR